jgi:uncharacterized protein (TIRG00374 family)
MKKYLKLTLKIIISASLIGYLLLSTDLSKVIDTLIKVNPFYFIVASLLIIINYIFSSVRWRYLVLDSKVSIIYMIKLYFIGSFFNNFLPTSIGGDAYKILKLGEKIGSKTNSFTATFLERFIGMIALLVIAIYGYLTFSNLNIMNFLIVFLLVILSFFGFLVFYPKFTFKPKLLLKIFNILDKIHDSFMRYKKEPLLLGYSFLASLVVQMSAIFTQYYIFKALDVTLPVDFSLFAFPIIFLSGYAIPSVNGIGSQEVLYTSFFSSIGVAASICIASSFLYHISRLVVSFIGGILYLNEK